MEQLFQYIVVAAVLMMLFSSCSAMARHPGGGDGDTSTTDCLLYKYPCSKDKECCSKNCHYPQADKSTTKKVKGVCMKEAKDRHTRDVSDAIWEEVNAEW